MSFGPNMADQNTSSDDLTQYEGSQDEISHTLGCVLRVSDAQNPYEDCKNLSQKKGETMTSSEHRLEDSLQHKDLG